RTATTSIYPLSLHDALPIWIQGLAADLDKSVLSLSGGLRTAHPRQQTLRATIDWSYRLLDDAERTVLCRIAVFPDAFRLDAACADRKSTRLNSSHGSISYAV